MPARRLLVLVSALALASGCGDDDEGGASGAAAAIPTDPLVYVEADISGEGEQAENLDATLAELGEVPLLGSAIDPRALIDGAIEDLGQSNDVEISYEEDFEPWLGDTLAVGYSSLAEEEPGFVLAIDATDEDVARDAINRITEADAAEETEEEYDGVSYKVSGSGDYAVGVFDEKLVLATVDQFEAAVDASRGDSVASSGDVSDALDVLGSDRLATVYVDADAALGLAVEQGEAEQAEADAVRAAVPEIFEQPVVAALGAGERAFHLDVAVGRAADAPETGATDRLADAPEDSFAALGVGDLGDSVSATLDRIGPIAEAAGESGDRADVEAQFEAATGVSLDEALASVGDVVAYGRGELPGSFSIRLDAEVNDDGAVATKLVEGLRELAEEDRDETVLGPPLGGGKAGFSAQPRHDPDSPIKFVNVAVGDDLSLVAASDRKAAEAGGSGSLGDTPVFQAAEEALGSEHEMVAFADLGPILDAALGTSSLLDVATGEDTPEEAIAGFLADRLGFAAAGVRYDGDFAIQRLVVGLK